MNSRERMLTTLRGGIPDRIGRFDSIWAETYARWRTEGLGETETVDDVFGFDLGGMPSFDLSLRLPVEIYEDTDEYRLQKDANGVTHKDIKGESGHTPHWLDYTLRTARDWYEYKDRLTPTADRIPDELAEVYADVRSKGRFAVYPGVEAYECAWHVFGQVNFFMLMMDEPEAAADVVNTYADMIVSLSDQLIQKGIDVDGAFFFGDLGYRNATLFSPALYEELVWPAHKRICDFYNSLDKPVILHSCGKIECLIPKFIEAGFAAIQPLEAKCGQDVRVLKERFGNKITFMGNIDVRKLSGTRADIEEEISSKLSVAMKGGGYIYHSDHSIPPSVSYDNFRYAMELVDKYGKY